MSEVNVKQEADQLWERVARVAQATVDAALARALANLRPGGAHPLYVEVASPTASALVPVAKIPVLYPCVVTGVDLMAQPGETATAVVDLKVARPRQALSSAATICGAVLKPQIYRADWGHTNPADDWTTYIEPGSKLLVYVESVSGTDSLGISVNVRCL